MIIFIRQIPGNTSPNELHNFVRPALKGGFFQRSTPVQRLEVIKIQDMKLGTSEYHGLVYVDSQSAGERAIKKLNGKSFNNAKVVVREYCLQRKTQNDRRSQDLDVIQQFADKRVGDRRRNREQLETKVCGVLQRVQTFY